MLTCRRATLDDAAFIAGIHVRSWQWAYRGLIADAPLSALTVEDRLPGWCRVLGTTTDHRVWVAEEDGRAVGFAAWGPTRDTDAPPGSAELYSIYLERVAAGRGIADALVSAALKEVQREGLAPVFLWVLAANPRARAFYVRHGWRLDGGRKLVNLLGTELEAVRYRLERASFDAY